MKKLSQKINGLLKYFFISVCLFAPIKAFSSTPKLVIVVVFDQLRSDQIVQNFKLFSKNGFKLFFDSGAVIPYTEYRHLQNMTCPGHATILSGSWPAQHKIPINDWYDKNLKKNIYCVQDENGELSPKNFQAGHLGDEIKLDDGKSKVVTVALKDRAAILLGGKAADAAYWFDFENNKFITSNYYLKNKGNSSDFTVSSIPKMGTELTFKSGQQVSKIQSFEHHYKWGDKKSYVHPTSIQITLDAAKKLIVDYNLGRDDSPDLLAVSFSTHDIVGHQFGPQSAEMLENLKSEDAALADLIQFVQQKTKNKLSDIVFVVTSDHGAAPLVSDALKNNLDSGRISQTSMLNDLNSLIKKKFPDFCKSSSKDFNPIAAVKSFQFYFDSTCDDKIPLPIRDFIEIELKKKPGVETIIFKDQITQRQLPIYFEKEILFSYTPDRSGDFIILLKPYWYIDEGPLANHITNYSYDRFVPLLFLGKSVRKTQSLESAEVVDLAPTLSAILNLTPPAKNQGRILKEVLKENLFQ